MSDTTAPADAMPPLPREPEQSWFIDDDGAQHPCMTKPTFSAEEMYAYARAYAALSAPALVQVAWAEIDEDELGGLILIGLHFDKNNIKGDHRRLPLYAHPQQGENP